MRELNFEDTIAITKIIKKMNIRKEIKEVISSTDKDNKNAESLGMDVAFIFVENISAAEREIYSFFSNLTGKKVEEIKKLKLTEVINMIKELFTSEDMKQVFSTALNLQK